MTPGEETSRHEPHRQDPNPANAGCDPVSELDDGFGRWLDREHDAVAERPVVSAAVTRKRSANVGAPQHDRYRIRKQRSCSDGKALQGPHRGTMESNSTGVNDHESHRMIGVSAAIVDDEIGGGPKLFPDGRRLFRTRDGLAIDACHDVAGA